MPQSSSCCRFKPICSWLEPLKASVEQGVDDLPSWALPPVVRVPGPAWHLYFVSCGGNKTLSPGPSEHSLAILLGNDTLNNISPESSIWRLSAHEGEVGGVHLGK